jgi:DNA-binding transcriptional LysR family regulator
MNRMLLDGELDFAFVDDFAMDKSIAIEKVYDEILELCVSEKLLKAKGPASNSAEFYDKLDYVDYQDGSPVLKLWFAHHLGDSGVKINTRATVMDVQGVARLIQHEMGAGILPGHLIEKLRTEKTGIAILKGCGKPLKNAVSLAYLRERSQSAAAMATLAWLKKSVARPSPSSPRPVRSAERCAPDGPQQFA